MAGGPRDWMPPEINEAPRHNWTTATYSRRPTVRNGAGWLSLALGALALGYAIFQAGNFAIGHGFAASTVGICAVAYGVFALALRRRFEATLYLVPVLGVILGLFGTGIMGTYVAAHYLNSGNTALPEVSMVGGVDFGSVGEEQPPPTGPVEVTPGPAPDPITQDFRVLAQHAASAAFAVDSLYPTTKPAALSLSGSDGLLSTPDGHVIAQLPMGTAVVYAVTPDQLDFTLTLVSETYGTRVVYDGLSDTITTR